MAEKSEKRRIYLYINGKEVEDNLKSLTSTSRQLKNEIAKLTPGTDDFIQKSKELQQVNGRISSINKEVKGLGGVFGSLKTAVSSNLFTMVSWGAAIGAAGSIIKGAYKTIADFDESVANLAKTTGLSKDAARDLAKEVIKIDTRTPVSQLIELASAAGRLNVKAEDIVAFTRSADMAFVALGDSLTGNAEEIGTTLGKIAGNFDLEKKYGIGEAINKIGSSLNDLGAKSKAAEGPIVDFTQRLAGVASQSGLTLPDVQALGALFDESGQSIEVAATTMNTLLPAMGKDVEKFAKVANMNVDEFAALMRDKPMEALKAVAIGAKSSEKGLVGLSETLTNYGVDSARSASIVGVLSDKTDRLTELQQIANGAFEDGTSLMNEFAVKNDTLSAKTEKLSKNWDILIIGIEDGSGIIGNSLSNIIDKVSETFTGISLLTDSTIGWEDKLKIIGNTATSFFNYFLKGVSMILPIIDKIAGTDLAGAIEIPQMELASTKIEALSNAVNKLTLEQLESKKAGLEDLFIKAGMSADEAAKKVDKLILVKKDSSKINSELKDTETTTHKKTIEEIEAEEKAAKKLSDEKIKANKKAAEEEVKEKQKLAENIDKLREEAKLKAMDDDQAAVERVYLKYEKLMEADLLNEEQKKELQLLRNEELDILDQEQEAKRIEKDQKAIEDKAALQLELDNVGLLGMAKELADADAKYQALYEKAKKNNLDTAGLTKAHEDEIVAITLKGNKQVADDDEKVRKQRNENAQMVLGGAADLAANLSTLYEKGSAEQKALAKAAVVIDGARAVMQILGTTYTGFAGIDVPLRIAGIAGVAIQTANQLSAISNAKYDKGGFTGNGFGSPDGSGYKVAGVVHEDEWVAPKWMTSSPQFADTINALEYARQTKTGFAAGGYATTSTTTPTPNFDNGSMALTNAINNLNAHLAVGIKAEAIIDQNGLLNIQTGLNEIYDKQKLLK